MVINVFLAIIAYKMNALTKTGIISALMLGITLYYFNIEAYAILVLYYVTIVAIEKVVLKSKNEKRTFSQVLANSIFAITALFMYIVSAQHKFFVIYCTMLSISMCDTIASTIGTQFARKVYSITTFRQIERGVSGGVSFWGSVAGILGSGVMALLYFCVFIVSEKGILKIEDVCIIFICGVLGMIVDSILGDLLQKKYYCKLCGKITDNSECCGVSGIPIGVSLFTNSQINVISEGIVFFILLEFLK